MRRKWTVMQCVACCNTQDGAAQHTPRAHAAPTHLQSAWHIHLLTHGMAWHGVTVTHYVQFWPSQDSCCSSAAFIYFCIFGTHGNRIADRVVRVNTSCNMHAALLARPPALTFPPRQRTLFPLASAPTSAVAHVQLDGSRRADQLIQAAVHQLQHFKDL